jgi:hypothetical protein
MLLAVDAVIAPTPASVSRTTGKSLSAPPPTLRLQRRGAWPVSFPRVLTEVFVRCLARWRAESPAPVRAA